MNNVVSRVAVITSLALSLAAHAEGPATTQSADDSPIVGAPTDPRKMTKPEEFAKLAWDTSHKGQVIDLTQYKQTFNDDFKKMNVVKDSDSPGPDAVWFAPGHGAYRKDAPLRSDGPFQLVDDGLRLRVETVGKSWKGACMTSVNTRGEGFAQQYGYFEMNAQYDYKLGKGGKSKIWGGFWLKSQCDYFNGGRTTRTEIDINEFYGDDGYHPSVHLWPASKQTSESTVVKHLSHSGFKEHVAPDLFKDLKVDGVVKGFHTYGAEITPQWVIMYFDRKEVGRFPTVEEFKTPLYMLIDVVIGKPAEDAVLPIDMVVKNVSAYLPIKPYEQ